MVYLEYVRDTGLVVAIHNEEPIDIREEHAIYTAEGFNPGDEVTYCIYVTLDSYGNPVGTASIQQSPPAQYIMQKLKEKDEQIATLEQLLADLTSLYLEV